MIVLRILSILVVIIGVYAASAAAGIAWRKVERVAPIAEIPQKGSRACVGPNCVEPKVLLTDKENDQKTEAKNQMMARIKLKSGVVVNTCPVFVDGVVISCRAHQMDDDETRPMEEEKNL